MHESLTMAVAHAKKVLEDAYPFRKLDLSCCSEKVKRQIKEAQEKLAPEFPYINVENEFAEASLPAVQKKKDEEKEKNDRCLAVSLFILGNIGEQDKSELPKEVSRDVRTGKYIIPETMYDEKEVGSAFEIVRRRMNKTNDADDERFRKLYGLVPDEIKENCANKAREKIGNVFKQFLTVKNENRREEKKICRSIVRLSEQYEMIKKEAEREAAMPFISEKNNFTVRKADFSNPQAANEAMMRLLDKEVQIAQKVDELLGDKFDKNRVNEGFFNAKSAGEGITIEDPFEFIFGVFALETEDDIVVLPNMMKNVCLDAAINMLPWNTKDKPLIETVCAGNDRILTAKTLFEKNITVKTVPGRTGLLKDTINLGQLIYHLTGVVLSGREDHLSVSDDRSGRFAQIDIMSTVMCKLSRDRRCELALKTKEQDIEAKERTIVKYSEEIASLKKENARLLHILKEKDKRIEAQATEKEDLKKENKALQEVIYKMGQEERAESVSENETLCETEKDPGRDIFPLKPKGKVVVFGGHDSWLREIKKLVEGVRFVRPETRIDISLVKNADVIWVQTNAIPHMQYDKILDLTRTNGIPLKYFASASAQRCAKQLGGFEKS